MKEDREALRQKILGARDGLSDKARQAKSISVMQNFWTLLGMQQWSTLFIYVNFRSEVETLELIKKCIKIYSYFLNFFEMKDILVSITFSVQQN